MYAAIADMTLALGQREVSYLSDQLKTGQQLDDVLTRALGRASAEIDSYLTQSYRLPITAQAALDHLRGICVDVARYHLTGSYTNCTDEIRNRYRDAIAWLRDVIAGRANLPGVARLLTDATNAGTGPSFIASRRNDWSDDDCDLGDRAIHEGTPRGPRFGWTG